MKPGSRVFTYFDATTGSVLLDGSRTVTAETVEFEPHHVVFRDADARIVAAPLATSVVNLRELGADLGDGDHEEAIFFDERTRPVAAVTPNFSSLPNSVAFGVGTIVRVRLSACTREGCGCVDAWTGRAGVAEDKASGALVWVLFGHPTRDRLAANDPSVEVLEVELRPGAKS